MQCNVCGCTVFVDMHARKNCRCAACSSLERTRLLWMYLERMGIDAGTRVLHLAPEQGIHARLSRICAPGNYVAADIDPSRYRFAEDCVRMDLCDLDAQPSCQFDLIVHCHVLEHVPCNIAYPLFHLHRMLRPAGVHACVIPFMPGKYDESFQDIGPEERIRRFGQFDHVRRFGREDIPAHVGSLLKLPASFDAAADFAPDVLLEANIPEAHWRGFHISTVLVLRREDFLLADWNAQALAGDAGEESHAVGTSVA